jgi:predicted HTH domain antitoxin
VRQGCALCPGARQLNLLTDKVSGATITHNATHIWGHIMKRTNVLLTDEQHKRLKYVGKKEGKSLGELVRDAVDTAYGERDKLKKRQSLALNAYAEGLISLGKLAEFLGMDTVSTRLYLKEHGIKVTVQELDETPRDARNA